MEYVEFWIQNFDQNLQENDRFSAQRLIRKFPLLFSELC